MYTFKVQCRKVNPMGRMFEMNGEKIFENMSMV